MSPLLRELDHRRNDGIDVRLLWSPSDDRIVVAVGDAKTGERFRLDVRADESPLDVFRHPYAYAAPRRTARESDPAPTGAPLSPASD
jgi:hypothetical protein